MNYDAIPSQPAASRVQVLEIQSLVPSVFVEDSVLKYIHALLQGTRKRSEFRAGASVRAGLALKIAAQSYALLNGRDYVLPGDVLHQVPYVMAHRLHLVRSVGNSLVERETVRALLKELTDTIPVPV
jgi:MoxR-like ATPase